MKYNLSSIMRAAWRIFRKGAESFATALRMAWANAKAHRAAKSAAGITEEINTWSGWQKLGYEVAHGSKALFGCDLIYASKGDDFAAAAGEAAKLLRDQMRAVK